MERQRIELSVTSSAATLNVADRIATTPEIFRWLVVVALAAAIFALSIVPGEPRPGDSAFAWAVAETPTVIQKAMHIAIYGLLTVSLVWAMQSSQVSNLGVAMRAVSLAIAFGALLEWIQLHVPGRFGNVYDVALNSTGAICGLFIAARIRRIARARPDT